jgi:hypothetical protein
MFIAWHDMALHRVAFERFYLSKGLNWFVYPVGDLLARFTEFVFFFFFFFFFLFTHV